MGNVRVFEDVVAVRTSVPLLVGLMGPSGGGKTFSALRLATGMQRVTGGEIYVIDTEARRALHYADRFKFRHLAFGSPFSPDDYLAAIQHCVNKGAKQIIVDSASLEHEGQGGVLEMHEAEVQRLGGQERHNFPAWAKPKAARRRLINALTQFQCNFVFCFRAKEKTKPNGGKLIDLGFMPIAGEEFIYEMTINALLLPNAGGVPTWASDNVGEKQMIKLPEQFRKQLISSKQPLSEDMGEMLARWAAGDAAASGVTAPPAANNTQAAAVKPQAKAQPKPSQAATKPESGSPANGLRFHPKFGEHGNQLIEGAEAAIRNEYDRWLVEYVSGLSEADQVKGNKHLGDFRELHLQLTAEERMAAEESAA